ncbi:hypothetical protein OROMI_022321 [Orobanche minor]
MGPTRKAVSNLSRGALSLCGGLLCETRTLSRIFSIKFSSQSPHQGKEEGELCREGNDGEIRHADSGSASGVGRGVRDENTIEKVEESIDGINHKETIMEEAADSVEDEGELMKKLGNERGGKPVDEVEGLDVYWRPIDENKL